MITIQGALQKERCKSNLKTLNLVCPFAKGMFQYQLSGSLVVFESVCMMSRL